MRIRYYLHRSGTDSNGRKPAVFKYLRVNGDIAGSCDNDANVASQIIREFYVGLAVSPPAPIEIDDLGHLVYVKRDASLRCKILRADRAGSVKVHRDGVGSGIYLLDSRLPVTTERIAARPLDI